jgi:hypothetical protein
MYAIRKELQHLDVLEAILVEHRAFGDSDYIHEQLHICYIRRLGKIAAYLPAAGQLRDALSRTTVRNRYCIIGETVVRCAIDRALGQLETGTRRGLPLDECEEVFRATIHHLEEGKSGGPLERGIAHVNRLGSEPYHGWVWTEEHSADVFGQAFRSLIRDNYNDELYTPNTDELRMLEKGAQLLSELLPLLSRSALSHVHLIAVFLPVGHWKGKMSSSQFRLGGTIFLSRDMLQNPWWVAEHLLHESLHQKLYDFRHGHSVFVEELLSSRETAKRVCSLWNVPGPNKSNYWDTFRAVAAFHVYVQLALLCRLAEQRAPYLERVYGPLRAMTKSRTAMDRAHYLGEQIEKTCHHELGLAGRYLIEWLLSFLDALDPSPPPRGANIHLLLDRYRREAAMVEKKIQRCSGKGNSDGVNGVKGTTKFSSILQEQLRTLITDEVKSTCSVLSAVEAEADLCRFREAIALRSGQGTETEFGEVRRLIANAIQNASPDGYRLKCCSPESPTPDEIVKQMVETSSQRLESILSE